MSSTAGEGGANAPGFVNTEGISNELDLSADQAAQASQDASEGWPTSQEQGSVAAHNSHRNRVTAVFSAFRPESALIKHCAALAPQVARIIVVDDGSGESTEPVLAELEAAGITVLRQLHNGGIAAAMNCGIDDALESGTEFVITFDQDSNVHAGFVDTLVEEFDRATTAGLRVGMVAPEFFSSTPQTRMEQNRDFLEAYAPIQSDCSYRAVRCANSARSARTTSSTWSTPSTTCARAAKGSKRSAPPVSCCRTVLGTASTCTFLVSAS